jgi:DNA-binding NarL/FixJ family response regulator
VHKSQSRGFVVVHMLLWTLPPIALVSAIMTAADSHIRVAIVEDDPAALDRIHNALQGHTDITVVGIARNMANGKELVDKGGFDVLLCDLGLPDGSGTTLIRQASQKYKNIDIIVITVFADQAKVLDSIKAGARGYLLKDEQFDHCADSIREIRRGGSPINPAIARQLLKEFQPKDQANADKMREALSKREMEVLNLLARGFSFIEIGDILKISRSTVATYVKNIYQKLEVNSRSEAVFEASSLGIIDMPH